MSQIVKKVLPYRIFEIDWIEDWLKEMSSKGFSFQNSEFADFFGIVRFQKSAAQNTACYRILPLSQKETETPDQRKARYASDGWQYQGKLGDEMEVYKQTGEDPGAFDREPEVLIQKIRKAGIRSFLCYFFPLIYLMVLFLWNILWKKGSFFSAFSGIETEKLIFLLLCLFYIAGLCVWMAYRDGTACRHMLKRLKTGAFPSRERRPVRDGSFLLKQYLPAVIAYLILIALTVCCFLIYVL